MAFKVINKLFKGRLVQVCPCKGYGYISPLWNQQEVLSSKNLYCYYASEKEKARKSCFLKIFEKGGKYFPHEVKYNYKNEEIWIPENPQIIYFKIEVEGPNYRCTHLYDEKHLSLDEKILAEANSIKEPNFEALLKEQEEEALAEEKETSVNEVSVKEPEEKTEDGDPYDAYQDGQDCGARDYKEFHENLLDEYDLKDLSWGDRKDFERGYENGYSSAETEAAEELANNIQVCSYKEEQKTITCKLKQEEATSSRASEKEASKNRKAQKKAEEEAFKASFN